MKNSNGLGKRTFYAPLSKVEVQGILDFDRAAGFGPGGTLPNRNRFYLFLTQAGEDVQIRTVAVKAPNRFGEPVAKEVVRACVEDSLFWVRDLALNYMGGYMVDWSPEGVGPSRRWDYSGRWESEGWGLRCRWKIHARVVNAEMLEETRRFRYAAWKPGNGHILDYLKIYTENPGVEFLAKRELGRYCTKVALLSKLKRDRNFRLFFGRNEGLIKECGATVPEILKAYGKGISLEDAREEFSARREFRYCRLPRAVDARKALEYVASGIGAGRADYAEYLQNCVALGLDLADTKVAFPRNFKARARVVQDGVDVLRAKACALKNREMNETLEGIAREWSWLEQRGRAFRMVIPRAVSEFTAEGKALSNCLGESYAAKVARGEVLVVFVRKAMAPDAPFVAVEYDLKKDRISQCYGAKNGTPEDAVRKFVERTFKGVSAQTKEAA
jgi:hypothetical protein